MNKYLLVSVLTALALPAYADVESFVNAAKGSDVAKIQEFLQAGENVNAKNELGNTALHYATATGNSDMVKFLLENGADANIANDKGWTPLAIAEKKKLGDIVNMFQSAQNNKDLSDLVAKASENAQKTEQNVVETKDAGIAKVAEIKENTSAKVAEIKEKTAETVENIQEKTVEVKESVADKVAEVKQETTQKVETAKEVAQEKVDDVKKTVENTVSTTAENVKDAENKVETKAKEVVATAVAPVVQENAKTEVKAEAKAEESKAEPKAEVKSETKAEEPKAEPKAEPKVAPKAEPKAEPKVEPKVEQKAEAKPAPKPAPRRLIKPVAAKPAPKFLASNINKAIYAGDEEVVYCLYYLGLQTDQHNLTLAAEFFAGTTAINKSRFDYIADLALKYYDNASTAEMQNMANTCAKIITPKNRDKQNQIIRAMNKAIGY